LNGQVGVLPDLSGETSSAARFPNEEIVTNHKTFSFRYCTCSKQIAKACYPWVEIERKTKNRMPAYVPTKVALKAHTLANTLDALTRTLH
jgi:hypothetical protein